MRSREQDRVPTYNQFKEGQQLSFTLNHINPDGTISSRDYETQIKAVKGGGFFGQFLILEGLSFGLKTAIPDPWHDFWRRVNWGCRDFPYQVSELDTKLGHLATNLTHDAVYPISDGKFYSPQSPGYTLLPGTYAQGIEYLPDGRPPRYDKGRDEYTEFRQAQKEATELYYKLGLEQVGQVHEKNPFAMANVWLNEKEGRWELFDTLPAIPHIGRVWPILRPFSFHKEIRETLNPETGEITFDRIHTEIFSKTIEEYAGVIQDEALNRIRGNLITYEALLAEKDKVPLGDRHYKAAVAALVESGIGFGRALGKTAKEAVVTPYQLVREPKKLDELVLGGARKALETNTITQEEFDEYVAVVNDFSQREARGNNILTKLWQGSLLSALYAYYHIGGGFLKPFEIAAYLNSGQIADNISRSGTFVDFLVRTAVVFGIFSGGRLAGGLNSYLATKVLSFLSGKNLNTAAIVSAVPIAGIHAAIPSQFCVDAGSKSDTIWHYTVRNLIAKFSKINPAGGWGSEFEGRLWGLLGDKIIRWAK